MANFEKQLEIFGLIKFLGNIFHKKLKEVKNAQK